MNFFIKNETFSGLVLKTIEIFGLVLSMKLSIKSVMKTIPMNVLVGPCEFLYAFSYP